MVFTVQVIWLVALVPAALRRGAARSGIAGAAAAHVVVAALVVLPLYLCGAASRRHRVAIGWPTGVALPLGCGAVVALVSLAAGRLIALDVLALAVAGVAALAALGVEARRMRATARALRTVVASAG